MNGIEIDKIIEAAKIEPEVAARALFPGHRYPKAALRRISKAGSGLSAGHLSKLSAITGLTIEELFGGDFAKLSGIIVFELEGARVYYRRENSETRIILTENGWVHVYTASPFLTVDQFLRDAEERIEQIKN